MREIDIGWLAGLLEGEGSFFLSKAGACILSIGMHPRDIELLERIITIFKVGHINGPYSNGKVVFWKCTKKQDIKQILEMIYPLLGSRRKMQADKLLAKIG